MEAPLVSIITPCYNSGKFIADTIKSVQKQSYTDWELLVVDDCSSDETVSLVQEMASQDTRIKLFQLKRNSGAGIARDTALIMAQGRYIAFLDADDLWKPKKLEKQLDFLIQTNSPFTFSFYDCIDEEGNPLNKIVEAPNTLSYRQLFFCNYVGNLTGIYDADYFGKIAISAIRKRQDWMLWLTILKKIKTAQPVPEILASYRIRQDSISASKLNLILPNFAVYRKFHGYNFVAALFCMTGFLFTQLLIKPLYIKRITP